MSQITVVKGKGDIEWNDRRIKIVHRGLGCWDWTVYDEKGYTVKSQNGVATRRAAVRRAKRYRKGWLK